MLIVVFAYLGLVSARLIWLLPIVSNCAGTVTVCVLTVALGRKSVVVSVSVGSLAPPSVVEVGSHDELTRPPSCAKTVGKDSRYRTSGVGGSVEVIHVSGKMSDV
jgi:hypothetical protein